MRVLRTAVLLSSFAAYGFSQSSAPPSKEASAPTFKGQSNLVLIPTVVHDKSGAHIPNLKKEDFAVASDGSPRSIAVFEEIRPANHIVRRLNTQPGEFTNMVSGDMRPNRLTVIALDTISTPEMRQSKARRELLKILSDTIQPDSMVALVLITTTGTRVVHDFTSDPKLLIEALKQVVGGEPIARDMITTSEEASPWEWGSKLNNPEPSGGNVHDSPTGGLKNAQLILNRYYLGEFERRGQEFERRVAAIHELDALENISQPFTASTSGD